MNRSGRDLVLVAAALAVLAAACGPPSGNSTPSRSALADPTGDMTPGGSAPIGAWTTVITAEDLRAAGLTEAGAIAENSGTFTMTFDRDGTWTAVQQTEPAPRWPVFRGTWSATADDALDLRTTFPADYAGDVVSITWRVEEGSLRMNLVAPDDPVLRVNLESHPWQPAG